MVLTDIPAIKPSKGAVFCMAAFLVVFMFFFTRDKTESSQDDPMIDSEDT